MTINENLKEAFIIGVDELAKERLNNLTRENKVTPIDLEELSNELNKPYSLTDSLELHKSNCKSNLSLAKQEPQLDHEDSLIEEDTYKAEDDEVEQQQQQQQQELIDGKYQVELEEDERLKSFDSYQENHIITVNELAGMRYS